LFFLVFYVYFIVFPPNSVTRNLASWKQLDISLRHVTLKSVIINQLPKFSAYCLGKAGQLG